jgi:hypothetical protein
MDEVINVLTVGRAMRIPVWTCPRCDRSFGKANRAHECSPAMPIEVWFDERTEPHRRAAAAVLTIVQRHQGLIVEAVGVGVLIKRERTIVELRPKTRWLDLSFISTATIESERIARTIEMATGTAYFVHLADERDVDAELRRWLDGCLRAAPSRRR